jgi:hypothetical protein
VEIERARQWIGGEEKKRLTVDSGRESRIEDLSRAGSSSFNCWVDIIRTCLTVDPDRDEKVTSGKTSQIRARQLANYTSDLI